MPDGYRPRRGRDHSDLLGQGCGAVAGLDLRAWLIRSMVKASHWLHHDRWEDKIKVMSTALSPTNQTGIFARSLGQHEPIPSDVARFFLALELADGDRSRLADLAEKS